MRVLVTGGSGMLGSNVVERLVTDGHDVRAVDLSPARDPGLGHHHLTGDVRDADLMDRATDGVDAVIHCAAALPSYPAEKIRSIIVGGTRTVFGAAERNGVERTVHISSTAVYGLPKVVPTTEAYPHEPVDPYSAAKAEAETVAEEYRGRGMCVPILRPKTFVGPGRMGLFSMLFEWAEEGRNFPVLGKGDVRIQMFDIRDLVDAVVTALHAPPEVADDVYNLAAASFGTLREDFQAVLDAAGHGKRVIGLPARPALATLRLLGRARLSPVYDRLLHKLTADSYVSVDKARDRLGFEPKYSNQDAVLRTFEWWRGQRAAGALQGTGRTSRDAWSQGALKLVKAVF